MEYKKHPSSEVFCMDCMDYMKQLPDNFFSLCIADPPYGNANSTTPVAHAQGGNRYKKYEVERTGGNQGGNNGGGDEGMS